MSREATNRFLELVNDGVFDPYEALLACLSYMSEDEVADMCLANGYLEDEEEDDEETELEPCDPRNEPDYE